METIDEAQLKVLRLMRDATEAGIIQWVQAPDSMDWFHTKKPGPYESSIGFRWPSYNDEAESARDYVEVATAGRFMIGTPGYSLAIEILAAGLPDWKRHAVNVRAGYERESAILLDLLKKSVGP